MTQNKETLPSFLQLEFQQISTGEAVATMGLGMISEVTYSLENMLITIVDNSLKITYLSSNMSATSEQTVHTSEPFKYIHNEIEYLLMNQDGKLVIYKRVKK